MTYVFRNNTVERFLPGNYSFSGYDDFAIVEAEAYLWWYQIPIKVDEQKLYDEVLSFSQKLLYVADNIGDKQLIVISLENWYSVNSVENDWRLDEAIDSFNNTAKKIAHDRQNIKYIDIKDFTKNYSKESLIDWKFYFISQMPLNPRLAKDFGIWFDNKLKSLALKRKKCLVLDLDNTLWSGILGEDGIEGIQIDGDYPGKAFHFWQECLKSLAQNGVILSICSKNNEQDVKKLWATRLNMVLKESDFSCIKINWNDKATNIKNIASELNIGLDSMVFIDDNPTERELIRQTLPEVSVPDWPAQPYELPAFFEQIVKTYFIVYSITDEDRNKTEQYRQNVNRANFQTQFTNIEDFLKSLEMQLTIKKVDAITISRISQLTQKTNQFNLTTKRYTENDIQMLLNNGALIYTLSVADKFGDNGITGCVILIKTDIGWMIDTFLLSCRILGKGIETAFIKYICSKLGACTIEASYQKTEKNAQVKEFYDKVGFGLIKESEDERYYKTDLSNMDLAIKNYYKILE